MSNSRIVFKNIAIFFSSSFLDLVFLLIFNIYIARKLGVTEFGRLSFAAAFVIMFIGFSDCGIHRYLNIAVAKDVSCLKKIFGNALLLKSILSIFTFIAIHLTINLLKYGSQTKSLVYLFALAMIVYSFQLLFVGIFRGNQKMSLEFISTWFEKPLHLVLVLLALGAGFGILSIAYLLVLVRCLVLCVMFLLYFKNYGIFTFQLSHISEYRDLFLESLPYGIFFTLGVLYFNIDTVMLSYFHGDKSVGIYQAVMKLVAVTMILPEAITESVLPRMASYYHNSKAQLKPLYDRTIKLLAFSAFPILAFFLFTKSFIINTAYGSQYMDAIRILPIMGLMIFIRFIASGTGVLLTASGFQTKRTLIVLACTALNIILNFILIPRLDYFGSALAALVTNLFLFLVYSVFCEKALGVEIDFKDLMKFMVSFIFMSVALILISKCNIYLGITSASCIFLASVYYSKVLTPHDILILRNIIWRENKDGKAIQVSNPAS